MRHKSKKVLAAEKWVDNYIEKNKIPPTYSELAKGLKISKTAAYGRCIKFIDKMKVETAREAKMRKTKDFTEIHLKFLVPNEKFEQFAKILSQLNGLLNNQE